MTTETIFMNCVSNKMIHKATSSQGKTFFNVSIPVKASENGFGSFTVSEKQVFNATKKNGDAMTGFKNVLLGAENDTRKVSIKTANGYETIEMTNKAISDAFIASRKEFKATVSNNAIAVV